MHVRELVEVAGIVALNGPLLAIGPASPEPDCLDQYWSSARSRFENWARTLKSYATASPLGSSYETYDQWVELRAVLDEVFVSEMLARVWTAVLVARDRRWLTGVAGPIARNVLASHLEARRRALAMLVSGRGIEPQQAAILNRIRRRAERWTDVLVGGVMHLGDVREFAIDPARAEDFASDLATRRNYPGGRHAWRMTLVSLRNAFQGGLSPIAANPEPNARIAASILGAFPADLFDATGVFHSMWMMRLSINTADAQGMITDLLHNPPTSSAPKEDPFPPRHRRM